MAKSKTSELLDWALKNFEKNGDVWTPCPDEFKRAAAQHFKASWSYKGFFIELNPPHIIEGGPYKLRVRAECRYCDGFGHNWIKNPRNNRVVIKEHCHECMGKGVVVG